MWGHIGWGGGWGGPWMYGVFHLLWRALIIVGAVLLVRWLMGTGHRSREGEEDRALAIVRERYARGEIDKAEFDARKQDRS